MTSEAFDQLVAAGEPGTPATTGHLAKTAAEFGEDNTIFTWYPYLPVGDYSVLMAEGGTGKTVLCCGIAAAVSTGTPLPGDTETRDGRNVLIITAEDSGEKLKKRLTVSGADLTKVLIIDPKRSVGINLHTGIDRLKNEITTHNASLVIVDPWHAFLGAELNINKVNALRPVLQGLANLAKECCCSIVLVSHINKKAQGENANNAATGSVDFVNAARSAFRVIFDEEDEDTRILVHTKSNYAPYGQSVKYRILDGGGVEWTGYSEVTRQTLETAARRRSTPGELLQQNRQRYANNPIVKTIKALLMQSSETGWTGTMSDLMDAGKLITQQPLASTTRALSSAVTRLDSQLLADGINHERIPHGTGGGRHHFYYATVDNFTATSDLTISF